MNGTIDIAKLFMAVLVIGIHTEPFSFNFWLDKGFGIVTRLCVPFFFVSSGDKASFFANLLKIVLFFSVQDYQKMPVFSSRAPGFSSENSTSRMLPKRYFCSFLLNPVIRPGQPKGSIAQISGFRKSFLFPFRSSADSSHELS